MVYRYSNRFVLNSKRIVYRTLDAILAMTDDELMQEVKKRFPIVTEATRAECLKFIIADVIDKQFPTM